jgi:hypothetical protein
MRRTSGMWLWMCLALLLVASSLATTTSSAMRGAVNMRRLELTGYDPQSLKHKSSNEKDEEDSNSNTTVDQVGVTEESEELSNEDEEGETTNEELEVESSNKEEGGETSNEDEEGETLNEDEEGESYNEEEDGELSNNVEEEGEMSNDDMEESLSSEYGEEEFSNDDGEGELSMENGDDWGLSEEDGESFTGDDEMLEEELEEFVEEESEEETMLESMALLDMFRVATKPWYDCGVDVSGFVETSPVALSALMFDDDGGGLLNSSSNLIGHSQFTSCDKTDEIKFRATIEDFDKCVGTGVYTLALIETLPSVLTGSAFKCFTSALTLRLNNSSSILSSTCWDSILGNHPLGNFLRYIITEPDRVTDCVRQLESSVPSCTLDQWPIPIADEWVHSATCIWQKFGEAAFEQLCLSELTNITTCVSSSLHAKDCEKMSEKCPDSWLLTLPTDIRGIPLPDACIRVAQRESLEDAVSLYKGFVTKCVPDALHGVWSTTGGDGSYSAPRSSVVSQELSNSASNDGRASHKDSDNVFFHGMLTGVGLVGFIWIAFAVVRRIIRRFVSYSSVNRQELSLDLDEFS